MKRKAYLITVLVVLALLLSVGGVTAQDGGPTPQDVSGQAALGTAFTYQGQLKNASGPVTGSCSMAFRLYDAAGSGAPPTGGNPIGSPLTQTVSVANGLFTTALDFGGSAFTGSARWLQIGVQCPGDPGFTTLAPRQALTATPYALYARGNWGLSGNGGTSASNVLGTTDNMTLTLVVSNTAALRLVPNATSPNVIGGYSGNSVSPGVAGATIAGGGANGSINTVSGNYGTVGGGYLNIASGFDSTVGGGYGNTARGEVATVGGGYGNYAGSDANGYATVGGGYGNTASGSNATVGGGQGNTASGDFTLVGGGENNNAGGQFATVGGGQFNTASGQFAAVPGGAYNVAQGNYSFAGGYQANALHSGAFVWADDSITTPISSTASNQFLVRASGGITLYTNSGASTGVQVPPGGGSWSSASDRNLKANFASVDGLDILNRLMVLPIQTWNYKTQDAAIRHIGPMAQDFYAAFNVGEDNTHISTVDAQGVALAAIQGLYQLVQEKDAQIADLEARLTALEQRTGPQSAMRNPQSALPLGWLLFGGLLLVNLGFVLGRGWNVKKGGRP